MTKPRARDGAAPDIVLLGADVLTLSMHQLRAQAVAVRDGRILAVGCDRGIRRLAAPSTRIIACQGGCLLPGFHDAHIHLLACASALLHVDCRPDVVSSIGDLQHALRLHARTVPPGSWIRAGGYDELSLAERRHPTRWDLDAAAPDHPVKLRHRSHHACVLNTQALRRACIDASFSPPAGALVEADPLTREPTGLLYEMDGYLERMIPPLDDASLRGALGQVFHRLLAAGITSVQDATARNGPRAWLLFQDLLARGAPRPRVALMVAPPHLDEVLALQHGAELVEGPRLGPVKIMLTEATGEFHPSPAELFEIVREVHERGLPTAIHAIDESAVCLATEAIAAAVAGTRRPVPRHRLEHAAIAPPALLERIAGVGVAVATQPGFIYHHGDRYLAEVDENLQGWLYALRAMLDHGLTVAAGSDAPVAPADPLRSIYAAVTRRSRRGQIVGAGERISRYQALVLHTLAPARLLGLDQELGTIEPGKRADLVLLSANPLAVRPEEIPEIRAELTMVGGSVAWERT